MQTGAVPAPVVVRALGVPVAIPVADAAARDRVRRQWSRALTEEPAATAISLDGLAAQESQVHDYALTVRVTMAALEATAGHRLNLHAGAVADPHGRAVAVLGASGTGKTTAVRALAGRLGYLSDETVSLSLPDRTVHPHPKPLSICVDPGDPRRKASVSPDDAGLVTPPGVARLDRLVLLHRGRSTDGLRPVTTPEAIVEVVPQTSSLVLLTHPLLTLAEVIDACGGAFVLDYVEFVDHLDEVVGLLDRDLPEVPGPEHHPPTDLPRGGDDDWSRAPWLDAVQYDDQLVVMVGDTAHLLAGLGTTLWLALGRPQPADQLVELAQEVHGAHPSAAEVVGSALGELAGRGLVVGPAGWSPT